MIVEKFFKSGAIISLDPDTVLVAWGPFSRTSQEALFYCPDFFFEEKAPWLSFESYATISRHELASLLKPHIVSYSFNWHGPVEQTFLEQFEELQIHLKSGHLQKAVPYTYDFTPTRPPIASLLYALLTKVTPVIYGTWNSSQGILGVTPELLLSYTPTHLTTIALAGTRVRPEELSLPKEQEENGWVVQGIKESLTPYGHVYVQPTQTQPFGFLTHLATPIETRLTTPLTFEEALAHLHPTAALGAYPKLSGHPLLQKWNQACPRYSFGAPFGFSHGSQKKAYIAIRNFQWNPSGTYLFAGCGVTTKSQFQAEWVEILNKMQATKNFFRLD